MIKKNPSCSAIPSNTEDVWETWEEGGASLLPFASLPPHLLLVEADTRLQAFLEAALREEGYALRVVSSLEHALALVGAQQFDLVLTDLLSHTRRKALSALKRLRQRGHSIKLGVLTSWNLSPEVAERQGLAFVLHKPIAVEQLLAEIAICLNKALTPEQERQVQVVEMFLGAMALKDSKKALSLCTEDIICCPPAPPLLPLTHTLSGKAALDRYLETFRSSYRPFRLEVQEIYSRPRGLVARYRMWWAYAAGGWEVMNGTLLFQFIDDRICQIGWRGEPDT